MTKLIEMVAYCVRDFADIRLTRTVTLQRTAPYLGGRGAHSTSKRRLTTFKRPSRAGAVLYASTWPATKVFMPAVSTSWTCTKNIGAAVIRQDEAKSAICVEEFDPASWHNMFKRTVSAPDSPLSLTGRG
jgi:hypothetical protein